jgi:DNA-directed RNA polymerase subunit RPC12/RpoP
MDNVLAQPEVPETAPLPEPAPVQDEAEKELVPLEVEVQLSSILKKVEMEDQEIRLRSFRVWRQLEMYMQGVFDGYWNEIAVDYRRLSEDTDDENDDDTRRNINIVRPHAESIIAALSTKVPGVQYYPDDAENPADVDTAVAYSQVNELISKHNKSSLMLIRALCILWNQGTVFGYNYHRTDPRYGTVSLPQTEQKQIFTHEVMCSYCGSLIGVVKETQPTEPIRCENCGMTLVPQVKSHPETIERIVGYTDEPKGREHFELFGPKNVKIPFWASKQEDCGYLLLKLDKHYAMLMEEFKEKAENISEGAGSTDTYERYMRLATEYYGNVPKELSTVKCLWLRPWMYNLISADKDNEELVYLQENFKIGVLCIFIQDKLVAIQDENLDDHWTISYDPLTEFIHGEPLGKPLIPVQDIENDILDLTVQSIEYGISENFVDPRVVDFTKYGKEGALPGMLTPAKAQPGASLSDGFYQTKPAVVSQEIEKFSDRLETKGQFSVADFPSLFGGTGDAKTAFEYNKSNAQALQRLSLTWKKLSIFWSDMMAKSVTEYVENMKEDEKLVKKENGKFINSWIRKEMMTGKIGSVEPESSDQLPQSWEQKWMLIVKMLEMKDEAINSVLLAPENAELMKLATGMPEFYIPGEKDRNKQFGEIYDIINGQPAPVDLEVDDHAVHMRIIKNYCVDPQGVLLYKTQPQVYQLIIQHYLDHQQAQVHNTVDATGQSQPGEKPDSAINSTAS